MEDMKFGDILGEGSFSTVLYAQKDKEEFAIKMLSKRHIIRENKVKYVTIEKEALYRISSPFVSNIANHSQTISHLSRSRVLVFCSGILSKGGFAPLHERQNEFGRRKKIHGRSHQWTKGHSCCWNYP